MSEGAESPLGVCAEPFDIVLVAPRDAQIETSLQKHTLEFRPRCTGPLRCETGA